MLTRYTMHAKADGAYPTPNAKGLWVMYSEVQKLEEENKQLKEKLYALETNGLP